MRHTTRCLFLLVSLLAGLSSVAASVPAAVVNYDLGYGANVAALDIARLQSMGFNWIKLFGAPASRLPLKVLVRLDAHASDLASLDTFRSTVRSMAQGSGSRIEAYEIGNEPNLDADFGWGAAPVAADYAQVLCAAYAEIKAHDPTAVVVSAGLAPTGRVSGNWNGHAGHNGLYQDERQFFTEFLAAGGANCADAIGYHNYGFSADFGAEPDVNGGTPQTNCTNGFCFRGVERIYEIMQAQGYAAKQIWTTEFGWITDPAEEGNNCTSDSSWSGRLWQIVSQARQAQNLQGAYEYAAAHWSWMGAMFIFNLDFNLAPHYPVCEQMRYYAVANRPAQAALTSLIKAYTLKPPELAFTGASSVGQIVQIGTAPMIVQSAFSLNNTGYVPVTVTVAVLSGTLPITVTGSSTRKIDPGNSATWTVSFQAGGQGLGTYSTSLRITTSPPVAGYPRDLACSVVVASQVNRIYLPLVRR